MPFLFSVMSFLFSKLRNSADRSKRPPVPSYTLSEVAQHDSATDLWMVIHGKVYDVTGIIDTHPGGAEVLFDFAGLDGTEPFDEVGHSSDSLEMLKPLFKGVVRKDQLSESEVDKLTKLDREWNDNDDNENDNGNGNGIGNGNGNGKGNDDTFDEDSNENSLRYELENTSIGDSNYWKTLKKKKRRTGDRDYICRLNLVAVLALLGYLYIQRIKWDNDV